MKRLTGRERVFTALHRHEPDMVPTFENHIDSKVREKIKPGLSYDDFIEYMDLDGITHHELETGAVEVIDEAKGLVRDKWGSLRRYNPASEFVSVFVEPPIKSEKDLGKYVPPDPDISPTYKKLEQSVKRFKGTRAVIVVIPDPSFTVRDHMLGQPTYFRAIKTNPNLIDALNEIAIDYYLKFLKNSLDIGADIVWIVGDLATNVGPFLSPMDTARFVMPSSHKIIEYTKSRGVPCLRHTDGNIWKIFDLLIEAGFDAIHPIDPVAGMDLGEAKKKYGDKVCLMGNVDCSHLMTWGTPEEVRDAVKICISQAGTGGGFICTTSNTVHSATKPENYVAMINAIRTYGIYPLQI